MPCTLKRLHGDLLQQYDCTEQAAPQPPPPSVAFKRKQVSPSASSSSQDQQAQQPPKSVIPTQRRVTEQLTKHWAPFKVLRQRYAGKLHLPQKHKATVPDSTLRVEMNNLEEQADNAKARELFWKPLSWLANRPTSANDAFDPALWETFVSTTLGLELPILAALPRLRLAHVPLLCQRA
jgi:hypothetical protein